MVAIRPSIVERRQPDWPRSGGVEAQRFQSADCPPDRSSGHGLGRHEDRNIGIQSTEILHIGRQDRRVCAFRVPNHLLVSRAGTELGEYTAVGNGVAVSAERLDVLKGDVLVSDETHTG